MWSIILHLFLYWLGWYCFFLYWVVVYGIVILLLLYFYLLYFDVPWRTILIINIYEMGEIGLTRQHLRNTSDHISVVYIRCSHRSWQRCCYRYQHYQSRLFYYRATHTRRICIASYVPWSVTCQCSIEMAEWIELIFDTEDTLGSCVVRKFGISKNKVLSSWTLSQTLNLADFSDFRYGTSQCSGKRVQQLKNVKSHVFSILYVCSFKNHLIILVFNAHYTITESQYP